jgi:Co/Zn/Cd efflux system component
LGFTLVQAFFALLARSEAMMADCAAMSVDAVTYLFNYCAERLKHRKMTGEEKALPRDVLHRRRKLHRLYLELFPPLLSVTTLLTVTVISLKKAISTLLEHPDDKKVGPDVMIMLVFSALNLVLDAVNVTCFSRADQAQGLPTTVFQHHHDPPEGSEISAELMGLLGQSKNQKEGISSHYDAADSESHAVEMTDDEASQDSEGHLNLNMCSAWTVRYFFPSHLSAEKVFVAHIFFSSSPKYQHICGDTLRSIAVLVASGVAQLFPETQSAAGADSYGAILVSLIIIVSLIPLMQGLFTTAVEIRDHLALGGRDSLTSEQDKRCENNTRSVESGRNSIAARGQN